MLNRGRFALVATAIAISTLTGVLPSHSDSEAAEVQLGGVFYNLGAQAGGSVISNLNVQQSSVAGYMNFTNLPGQVTLCGAGNLSGSKSSDQITGSFVSNDPDPGCGFDHGSIFNITATVDSDLTHYWGDYRPRNSGGSNITEFPGVFETWTTAHIPQRIAFEGTFTNTTVNSGGRVILQIALGTNTVSGFMNYTNASGQAALCGAGEFTGVRRTDDTIQFSFVSRDPDPGCGFDYGLKFVMEATFAPNTIGISGTYRAGAQGGVFAVTRSSCEVPFFWQRDPEWITHTLGSPSLPSGQGTECGATYDTLGEGGCTLTSAAMVFRYYGANHTTNGSEMNPANLSDCMNTEACPFTWGAGAGCSDRKAHSPKVISYRKSSPAQPSPFDWSRLEDELNQHHRPVILGMCTKSTCSLWDDDNPKTTPNSHWVLVVGGQGNDPANYSIWDPWYECGQNMRLNSYSATHEFRRIATYDGQPTCKFSTEVPQCATSVSPIGIPSITSMSATGLQTDQSPQSVASSVVTGTVWVYRSTAVTMTVRLVSQSSAGIVTDMLVWSDTISNTTWQAFAPYAWLPRSDLVHVRFRDSAGNVSDIYSDTTSPSAPPTESEPVRIHLPVVVRN